ncbi:MAG: hypothetical protein KA247_01585 [Bacteroidetes bacterium]|nr:hypothetical protein [Bacteroidota bacterium]
MKHIFTVCTLSLILLFGSCDTSEPTSPPPIPLPPSMSGTWSGGFAFLLRINVHQAESKIVGTGMFNGELGAFVSGSVSYPNVEFMIESDGFLPVVFTGSYVHPDTISGELNGSGFTNMMMVLGRFQ